MSRTNLYQSCFSGFCIFQCDYAPGLKHVAKTDKLTLSLISELPMSAHSHIGLVKLAKGDLLRVTTLYHAQ